MRSPADFFGAPTTRAFIAEGQAGCQAWRTTVLLQHLLLIACLPRPTRRIFKTEAETVKTYTKHLERPPNFRPLRHAFHSPYLLRTRKPHNFNTPLSYLALHDFDFCMSFVSTGVAWNIAVTSSPSLIRSAQHQAAPHTEPESRNPNFDNPWPKLSRSQKTLKPLSKAPNRKRCSVKNPC